ncbi:hypothetical protein Tco_0977965 [Tanacetum coccineum]|uniref:Uncharacterized protein n=1 Tax=Tanacetum coccineum TaxID=301880 RepID=A0ABQ5ELL6_9ASTR
MTISQRQFGKSKDYDSCWARNSGSQECRKPKRVKDYAYHKEKMMMCKQAEQGVPLQADWLEDTDEEIDEQELEAHYSYMAKIQEVSPEESSSTGQPLEQKDDSNVTPDSSNICTNDNQVDQNAAECVDERAALANLIANLTLDTEENKTILKQLKKANASLTQELEKCKTNLDETNSALGEAIRSRSIQSIHYVCTNVRHIMVDYLCQSKATLKKAQYESPVCMRIPFDTSDPAKDLP